MIKPNQDIRDYMADHGVTQLQLAQAAGLSNWTICMNLKKELPQKSKEMYLNMIDSIVAERTKEASEECTEETEQPEEADVSVGTKFQIGDRVKIPAKQNVFAVVSDIWSSLYQDRTIYEVTLEGNGVKGMYAENQLEPAPLPIDFSFEVCLDGNVAVVTMNAKQCNKTWVYARGHAHILHDGEVGMAQAVSYAARRMFESLDKEQENKIYLK